MEEKEKIIENPTKVFIFELIFFLFAQIFAILSTLRILSIIEITKTGESYYIEPLTFWDFILSFIIATFFILVLLRFLKKGITKISFKIIFVLVISLGSFIFFSLWVGDLLALIFLALFLILWLKFSNVLIHNFLILSGIIGIGSMLSLRLQASMVVLFLIIFSVYDFIAVYKTKHMVKMAKAMIEARAVLGIIVPSKISDLRANLKETSLTGKFLVLGGGDIVFPLLLAVSLVSEGVVKSLIIVLFSTLGLFLSFYLFNCQKVRQPIPALPPIALLSIIGYWISGFF